MTAPRTSYQPGHKPKCLVIVDDTAEWDRAVYYASRWAVRAGIACAVRAVRWGAAPQAFPSATVSD